jgi:hypothetical protein
MMKKLKGNKIKKGKTEEKKRKRKWKKMETFQFSRINAFSLNFASNYILSTSPFSDIQSDIWFLFVALYKCGCELLKILFGLIVCFGLVICKLFIVLLPHAAKVLNSIYEFHQTLTYYDICLEILLVACGLLCYVFRNKIRKWWVDLEKNISTKSKAVAKALPHVLFFSSSLLISVLGQKFIAPLTSSKIMPFFTLGIPLINLLYVSKKGLSLDGKQINRYNHLFTSLVVLGIYHSFVTCLSVVPFSAKMLSLLPYIRETIIVILLWVQISSVFATIVFTSSIKPVMNKLSQWIPAFGQNTIIMDEKDLQDSSQQVKTGVFVALARTLNVFNEQHIRFLVHCLQDSLVSLITFLSLFIPYPFSYIGMVAVAFILPSFRVVSLVNEINSFRLETIRRNSQNRGEVPDNSAVDKLLESKKEILMDNLQHWISYWICIFFLWIFRIYIFAMWSSIVLLLALWLQHSFFRGGATSINLFFAYSSEYLTKHGDLMKSESISVNNSTDDLVAINDGNANIVQENSEKVEEPQIEDHPKVD